MSEEKYTPLGEFLDVMELITIKKLLKINDNLQEQIEFLKALHIDDIADLDREIKQKDKQLDRQEATMLRLKEHDSYQRKTINQLRQKIKNGSKLKARNEKLERVVEAAKVFASWGTIFIDGNLQAGKDWFELDEALNQLNADQRIKESDV